MNTFRMGAFRTAMTSAGRLERRLDDKRPRKWRLKWGCVTSLEDETKTGVTGWRRWRSRGRDTQDMARRSMPRRSTLRSRLAMRRTVCYIGASGFAPKVNLRLMVRQAHHERKYENPFALSLSKGDLAKQGTFGAKLERAI